MGGGKTRRGAKSNSFPFLACQLDSGWLAGRLYSFCCCCLHDKVRQRKEEEEEEKRSTFSQAFCMTLPQSYMIDGREDTESEYWALTLFVSLVK